MLPTALAMAPRHPFRLAGRYEAHRAAEAATLELLSHGAPRISSRMVWSLRLKGLYAR